MISLRLLSLLNFPASKIFIFLYFLYLVNQSINISCNFYLEHRASTTHCHRNLFFAATFPCKNQSINQSMFPVTPIWSIGHPPHTATEICSSLPPSLARINQSINQSLFPVTPIWSIGHPPHYHRTLYFAATFIPFQFRLTALASIWTDLLQVLFVHPLRLEPCGFHSLPSS
jgi:hypothetical protein